MNNNLTVKIIKDSIISRDRYITLEAYYPRIIHSEVLRHRTVSHSVASSRAIPTKKYIENYVNFVPNSLRKNQKGMSPTEVLEDKEACQDIYDDYFKTMKLNIDMANKWAEYGLAKEQVNRVLEPFSYIRDLMTFSYQDIEDIFALRCHPDAQKEIRDLFEMVRNGVERSTPEKRDAHFPYVDDSDFLNNKINDLLKVSIARCARTSYDSNATGRQSTLEEDIELYDRLISSKHLSPSEHVLFSRRFFERQILNQIGSIQFFEINDKHQFRINEKEKRRYQFPFSGNLGGDIVQYRKILEKKA
jgi:thymidylate synthase ThyX